MGAPADPIDWGIAARVGRVAGRGGPETTPAFRRRFRDDLHRYSDESDRLVRDFTGLVPVGPPPSPFVLDRGGWVDANINAFRTLMAPLTDKLAERVGSLGIARRVTAAGLGLQIGLLLGYLSQKVLGQYDLVMASEGGGDGHVYYVGPNIVAAERRWSLDAGDFRLWIALHEITHRTQFASVPWLADTMHGLMRRSLTTLDLDPERMKQVAAGVKKLIAGGPEAWKRASFMDLLMSDDQRALIGEMQSVMTIVEGHGTFVMNRIGAQQIPTFESLKRALHGGRSTTKGPERAFQRAIGLDMKYEQYAAGERFFDAVADAAGVDAANLVWERPENLPSAGELNDPTAWLERVRA